MANEKGEGTPARSPSQADEAWQEVGKEFRKLGKSLGAAFRAAWSDAEMRERARHAQNGLETLVQEVGKVVGEMGQYPAVKHAVGQAATTVSTAGEETVREIRPHFVGALRQLNEELRKLADRLDEQGPDRKTPSAD